MYADHIGTGVCAGYKQHHLLCKCNMHLKHTYSSYSSKEHKPYEVSRPQYQASQEGLVALAFQDFEVSDESAKP